MRKHKNFMSEPDYGYIDIESCFEPIFEPPLETLEEWRSWKDEPEPTLENTSVYVTEPDGIQYFYCGNTRIRVSEHFSQAGKPMDKLESNLSRVFFPQEFHYVSKYIKEPFEQFYRHQSISFQKPISGLSYVPTITPRSKNAFLSSQHVSGNKPHA